ncbi:MAG: polysaccharide biosynthesis tyrosine autokinase [Victivallaceae bacterium]|nr:polysaccharide biosynthesis tyrosine autokinase [Victivallaceae bacterium]
MYKNESLMQLLNILRRHWFLLLLCSVFCAVCGYSLAKFVIPPRYRSDVLIYIGRLENDGQHRRDDDSISLARELYLSSQLVLDYTELAKSKRVLTRAQQQIEQTRPEYLIPFKMESNMRKNTRLLTLSVTASDPQAACFIANTLSQVFNDEISMLLELKNFQIVDRAEKAVKIFPTPWIFTLVSFLLSFGFLIALFWMKAFFDTRFNSPEQLALALKLPIIGSVPFDREIARQNNTQDNASDNRIVTLNNDEKRKRFGIREAFWGIRTNLFYSDFRSPQGARVIAITSSLAGEGKTFVSANLAATLADFGQKTLIINCDLRKPALSKALGVYSNVGLVNVLVEQYPLDDALQKNLFQRKLDALLCGPIPLNPLKLLDSEEFKTLLEKLRKQYDYIILDTPPCLEVSDGICIGKMADGVIFVSRIGKLREGNALNAIELLRQSKVSLLGVIANGTVNKKSRYYYQA